MRSTLGLAVVVSCLVLPAAVAFSTVPIEKPIASSTTTTTSTSNSESVLQTYQEEAGRIVASFEPQTFRPVPSLSNCHLQTIGGVYLRQTADCSYVKSVGASLAAVVQTIIAAPPQEREDYWHRRDRVETPDGDWFHVDFKATDYPATDSSKGLVVILHGLESNSKSPLTIDMAKSYERLGLDVCCINFRGCSGEPNDTVGAYHLGFTDDVKHYLDVLTREGNSKPIYLSAFSLGANVMMKALGELGEDAVTKYNVQGAALFCCPLNCEKHYTRLMEPGINKLIYNDSILKSLQNKAQLQLERCCDNDPDTSKFNYRGAMEADTIYEFENTYIAPIYGFEDPMDYYRQTASINEIENVAVPTFVLNGADDTFMDGSYQPVEFTREHGGRAPVKMVFSEQGGHCGFIFHQLEASEPVPETSFGPSEMARFIGHVMENSV